MPQFLCPGLVVDQEELVTSEMFGGKSYSSSTPRTSGLRARRAWT